MNLTSRQVTTTGCSWTSSPTKTSRRACQPVGVLGIILSVKWSINSWARPWNLGNQSWRAWIWRQWGSKRRVLIFLPNLHINCSLGGMTFDKARDSMRNKKKHFLDRRLRNKLKRRFAKENLGSIIGRPKKPPIINSEKIDGNIFSSILTCFIRRWIKDIHMSCVGMWQDILGQFKFEKAFDDSWWETGMNLDFVLTNLDCNALEYSTYAQ